MTRRSREARLAHHTAYGDAIGAGIVQLLIAMDGQTMTPFTWCPTFPSAVRMLRVAVTAQCAADTTPGDWTLRLRKNESPVTDEATFTFPLTTTVTKTAGPWSTQVVFQAGDSYYVVAEGPSKDTVIARVVLEFEVL